MAIVAVRKAIFAHFDNRGHFRADTCSRKGSKGGNSGTRASDVLGSEVEASPISQIESPLRFTSRGSKDSFSFWTDRARERGLFSRFEGDFATTRASFSRLRIDHTSMRMAIVTLTSIALITRLL